MYQLSVKAIKSILLDEHSRFLSSLTSQVYMLDYNRYMFKIADETIRERISFCDTYTKLEDFIHESRRMSLQEWINSL